jgi:hypothetical protein
MDTLFGCGHDLDMKKDAKGLNNYEGRKGINTELHDLLIDVSNVH